MSNEVYDDYEQAEIVKKWIRENGLAIGMGIAMGLSGLFGWQYWKDYQYQQKIGAAQGYVRIIAELQEGGEASTDALDNFNTAHSDSAYAGLVALQLAGKAVANLNLEEAANLYKAAAETAEPQEIRVIAGLRLARVQLQMGQLQLALATVDRFDSEGFSATAAEIRGDILLAQGDRSGAWSAYQFALDGMTAGAGDRDLLQMKIDDLTPASVEVEALPETPEIPDAGENGETSQ